MRTSIASFHREPAAVSLSIRNSSEANQSQPPGFEEACLNFRSTLSILLAMTSVTFAQSDRGRLTGVVTDPTGAVIPEAKVSITNERTGEKRVVITNNEGLYVAPNLSPSDYAVHAAASGLAPREFTGLKLQVGETRTLNIQMQPEAISETIDVTSGELAAIDTSSAKLGTNVSEREVASMPLNGRQVSQLYLLAPGAQTSGGGSFDNIRFSGRANQQNAIRFDGVEGSSIVDASPGNLNGETSTGFRLQASLETIQEFRVESSNYPAEFGTGSAGQISVVTKSGSNAVHGGLFEYLRNSALDARNFFDSAIKTPLRLNQFGGSIGGPIVRNRLFVFGAFESLAQRSGINLVASVPSAAARARAVPSIQPLLAGYPMGKIPTANPDLDLVTTNQSSPIDEYYGSIRLDYRINDRQSVYLRYFRDQGYLQSPLDVSGSYSLVTAVPQNAVVNHQWVINSSMINEFKFGLNGSKSRVSGYAPPISGVDTSGFAVSFTGTVAIPGIGGQGASAGASALGNLVRSNSTQNGRGQPYTNYTMSFIDSLSVIRGNHNFKFGGEIRPIRMYTDRLGGVTYTFPSLNALLANQPSQIQVLGDTSAPDPFNNGATGERYLKQTYAIGYFQDEWKLRKNLTMSYGLRYEYYSVLREDQDRYALFIADQGRLARGPWYQSSKLNFGPRLAFSWAPDRFSNKTVFRIGAGYYFGPGQTEDQVQPIDSDRASVVITSGPSLAWPVNPAQVLSTFNVNALNGYQPRGYASGYRLPEKILSYTASIQQELPGKAILTVAYVGSQGRNLFLRSWTNGLVGVSMNPTTGAGIGQLQYGSQFAQIDYKTSGGRDSYNSMQTTLNRRFSRGLTLGAQWTYSHSLGNTGGSNEAQTTQNPFNFNFDRGNNAFDVRHSVNMTALYELPFGKGRRHLNRGGISDFVLGGWEVGGVVNARTGLPVDVVLSRPDLAYRVNSTGQFVSAPIVSGGTVLTTPVINNPYGGAFRNNRRPDVVAGMNPFLETGDRRLVLNPAAFAIPQPGSFGNLGRFALHGPGLSQTDLTLHKKFRITERFNTEFRAEMYNIFNRANFANPSATLTNALGTGNNQLQPGQSFTSAAAGGVFGQATSTVTKDIGLGAQRQIQFSLRLNF
jgi:hypothetical protein